MVVVTQTDHSKSVRNRCVTEVFGGVFVLSHCFLECSVGVGTFLIRLSQISSFFLFKHVTDYLEFELKISRNAFFHVGLKARTRTTVIPTAPLRRH